MAAIEIGYCSTFGIMTATRAPGFSPRLCSQAPSRLEYASTSA
jgi:hypothetical protein